MRTTRSRARRLTVMRQRLAVVAMAVATAMATTMVAGGRPADAAEPLPVLTLATTRPDVTGYRYHGRAYFDTGTYVVAGADPFEVRVNRPSYDQPLVATWRHDGQTTILPSGLASERLNGLSRFFVVTVTNSAGTIVNRGRLPLCPGGYDQVRQRPDAPATSPYPDGCYGSNPYSLGAVYGIQAGYASPVGYQVLKLKKGTYTATTTIAKRYRDALGLDAAAVRSSVKLTVINYKDGKEQTSAARSSRTLAAPTTRPRGAAAEPSGPQPDLRSLPAWGIRVRKGRYLEFSATVWNAGPGRLVVDGFRQADNEDLMDAYQYFFDTEGDQVGYAPVGTMEWDARDGHEHWHFTDFASYQLLNQDKELVVRSQKEAFCLANTDAVDYTVPGADWRPDNTDLHTACGSRESIGVREVLETGSGDTYVQSLPGQSFDLKGLKNGTYYIAVQANPELKLFEASTDNNISYRQVKVTGRSGHRKVTVAKVGIIEE